MVVEYSLSNKKQRKKIRIISFLFFFFLRAASPFRKGSTCSKCYRVTLEKKESIVRKISKKIRNREDMRRYAQ